MTNATVSCAVGCVITVIYYAGTRSKIQKFCLRRIGICNDLVRPMRLFDQNLGRASVKEVTPHKSYGRIIKPFTD
jgi:hypothetical protein